MLLTGIRAYVKKSRIGFLFEPWGKRYSSDWFAAKMAQVLVLDVIILMIALAVDIFGDKSGEAIKGSLYIVIPLFFVLFVLLLISLLLRFTSWKYFKN